SIPFPQFDTRGTLMNFRKLTAGVALGVLIAATAGSLAATEKKNGAIEQAVNGDWRNADSKSRDAYRHPREALAFWGLKPGMSILEIQPGGGWWTEILAP